MVLFHRNGLVSFVCLVKDKINNIMVIVQRLVGRIERRKKHE